MKFHTYLPLDDINKENPTVITYEGFPRTHPTASVDLIYIAEA